MTGMLVGDRMVRLEVAGMCQQNVSRRSNYSLTVPYGSMAQTMKNIVRQGGRVVGVHVSDVPVAMPTAVSEAPPPAASSAPTGKKGKKK
jgi:hypothetical protein